MMDWWIEFARGWLKLPPGNAVLPGSETHQQVWNPDDAYLSYRLLFFWIGSVFTVLVALALMGGGLIGGLALMEKEPVPGTLLMILLPGVGLFLLTTVALNLAIVYLELDMLRYTLTDEAIRLRRGVTKVEEVTLSYVNIQNVKFHQGPLQRWYGIADLFVETAGGGSVVQPGQEGMALGHRGLITGISRPEELRDLILERVREARGAGLGDDDDDDHHHEETGGGFDEPESVALLTEIRDDLKAARAVLAGSA